MELSWQQGSLSHRAIGRYLVAEPLPCRMSYAESLRRRMCVRCGGTSLADSEQVPLLFERARYQVTYFPKNDIVSGVLERIDPTTHHPDRGRTSWYAVRVGDQSVQRGGQHTSLPAYAIELRGRIAIVWRAMDAFERIVSYADDLYYGIDIRQTFVSNQGRLVADTTRPLAPHQSGLAPRWYVPSDDINASALTLVKNQTFCLYEAIRSYYAIGDARLAAWSYPHVSRIANMISSNRIKWWCVSVAGSCTSSPVRRCSYTAPIANSPSPRCARCTKRDGSASD
jgi:uncharacterized protein (DUF427 family)